MLCGQVLTVLAVNLNMPPEVVPLSKSFFELGGNSAAMIMSIVQLRKHSLYINIECFCRATNIRDLIDHVTELPTSHSAISDVIGRGLSRSYVAQPLESRTTDGHRTLDMFNEAFSAKERLTVLLGITAEEFQPMARRVYNEAIKVSSIKELNMAV